MESKNKVQNAVSKYRIRLPKIYEENKGFIYVVKVGSHIKIGKTRNPKHRLKEYSSFPPFEYEVLVLEEVFDCKFFERAMQHCVLDYQVKGEWFEIPYQWKDHKIGAKELFDYIKREIASQITSKESNKII